MFAGSVVYGVRYGNKQATKMEVSRGTHREGEEGKTTQQRMPHKENTALTQYTIVPSHAYVCCVQENYAQYEVKPTTEAEVKVTPEMLVHKANDTQKRKEEG